MRTQLKRGNFRENEDSFSQRKKKLKISLFTLPFPLVSNNRKHFLFIFYFNYFNFDIFYSEFFFQTLSNFISFFFSINQELVEFNLQFCKMT